MNTAMTSSMKDDDIDLCNRKLDRLPDEFTGGFDRGSRSKEDASESYACDSESCFEG